MNRTPQSPAQSNDHLRSGFLIGAAAYGLWGILPIYFKLLHQVPALDIVAHRVLWSLPFLAMLLSISGGWHAVHEARRLRRTVMLLGTTALLIGINWIFYVYAVVSGHILAGSLGYYLNPLANVLLGRIFLKEKLATLQWAAVVIAAAGISVLAVAAIGQLWISLILCASFATYGLLRKIAPVDAVAGLAIETAFLSPLALLWLAAQAYAGQAIFGPTPGVSLLLVASGVATAVPLLLFTAAARRLPYSTLGMLQFLAPTLQFLCAVLLYGEPFTRAHAIAFGSIWFALALYIVALVRSPRMPMAPE